MNAPRNRTPAKAGAAGPPTAAPGAARPASATAAAASSAAAASATAKPAEAQAGPHAAPLWRQDDGAPVSCLEKIKVLNDNYAELKQMAQDAFEDALLMGCSERQVREVLRELIDALDNPYPNAAKNTDQT
jgi:hypothetical protein